MWSKLERTVGILGASAFIVIFIRTPSFPTPDKIIVFATFVAMIYAQAKEFLKRFLPFAVLLLIYESFRGIAPYLNRNVNVRPMIIVDRVLGFGQLPTIRLQQLLWHGSVQWYDLAFYGAYTLHFVLPFALGVLIWKTRDKDYWRYMTSFVVLSFAGFITYVLFPAAPPWMASEWNQIPHIAHISSEVWGVFGIHDFPSVYNKIAPNPVAAVPSLHAAYAFLLLMYTLTLFKSKWKYVIWLYPLMIWLGTVYMGEHYLIDAVLGVLYAYGAYKASPYIIRLLQKYYKRVKVSLR